MSLAESLLVHYKFNQIIKFKLNYESKAMGKARILSIHKKKVNDELSLCLEEREFSSMMVSGISGCCHLTVPAPFLVFFWPFRQPPLPLSLIMFSPALSRPYVSSLLSTLRIHSPLLGVYTISRYTLCTMLNIYSQSLSWMKDSREIEKILRVCICFFVPKIINWLFVAGNFFPESFNFLSLERR